MIQFTSTKVTLNKRGYLQPAPQQCADVLSPVLALNTDRLQLWEARQWGVLRRSYPCPLKGTRTHWFSVVLAQKLDELQTFPANPFPKRSWSSEWKILQIISSMRHYSEVSCYVWSLGHQHIVENEKNCFFDSLFGKAIYQLSGAALYKTQAEHFPKAKKPCRTLSSSYLGDTLECLQTADKRILVYFSLIKTF